MFLASLSAEQKYLAPFGTELGESGKTRLEQDICESDFAYGTEQQGYDEVALRKLFASIWIDKALQLTEYNLLRWLGVLGDKKAGNLVLL